MGPETASMSLTSTIFLVSNNVLFISIIDMITHAFIFDNRYDYFNSHSENLYLHFLWILKLYAISVPSFLSFTVCEIVGYLYGEISFLYFLLEQRLLLVQET